MPERILGISCFFHDAAACLVEDGRIVAAAQEERFTRRKHDARFPRNAINYCLEEGRCQEEDLSLVAYYEKPGLVLDRILRTGLGDQPHQVLERLQRLGINWGATKLALDRWLERTLAGFRGEVLFPEHHLSHAASAFFPSPFAEAAVLTVDGVGEWATAATFRGSGNHLELLGEMRYPHSLGLFYSAFTYFTGFKVNSGEYKFMGLAPYGEPRYYRLLRDQVIQLNPDGTVHLNLEYFDFLTGRRMTSPALERLLDGPPRRPESRITRREMDIAASVQKITEEALLAMAAHLRRQTGIPYLCLAGGVALNCVANGKLLASGLFRDLWIQPAASDAGGAVGAALAAWHIFRDRPRRPQRPDAMSAALLGPAYSPQEIRDFLDLYGLPYHQLPPEELAAAVVEEILQGRVVALFQGRMEFGPRALGNRSILADPRRPEMQSKVNLKVKFRESFRPFAPVVLREEVARWFELDHDSPYMLLVAPVRPEHRRPCPPLEGEDLIRQVNQVRSTIPAVTHVDYSARIQTVHPDRHPLLHRILRLFQRRTGVPVLLNTSFNLRGEPIVCSPMDAYQCMMRTEIDRLFLENILVRREEQPPWSEEGDWRDEFALD